MRTRLLVGGFTSSIAAATVLCLPGLSVGGPLSDPGGGSQQSVTVQPNTPKPPPAREPVAQPSLAVPGTTPYVPPLHGANPHGQGTVGTIDLAPTAQRPLAGDPDGGDLPNQEEIVVGRSRGEQRADGTYHGHITILSLFGNEVVGVDTNQGETRDGPLQPIQNVLDQLCAGGTGPACLTLLRARSETTGTSSTNSFSAANLTVGTGGSTLAARAAESNGNISSDGTCQTAHGDSTVAGLTIGGGAQSVPTVEAVNSSSDSRACRGGAPTQTNSSDVIDPDVGVDPILPAGCGSGGPNATGTPNTAGGIAVLLPLVCNADDSNTTQTAAPYGVREALSVFVLVAPATDTAVAKITAGASESHAVAPAAPGPGPDPGPGPGPGPDGGGDDGGGDDGGGRDNPDDDGGGNAGDRGAGGDRGDGGAGDGGRDAQCEDGIDNDGDGKIDFPNDPQCESRDDDSEADGALAFTGVDVLAISLAGALMLAAGLGLRRLATGGRELA
ncbi:MAG: hypothetical protein M3131_07640 [Actinomycetota bacterium]|nr:hypothetical protein [Actinomycetota bacterium]